MNEADDRVNSVATAWRRIDAWLAAHAPTISKRLRAGAKAHEIAAAQRSLKLSLPDSLEASLAIHNGDDDAGVIGGWYLLGTRAIAREAAVMRKLVENGTFDEARGAPHSRIQRTWWNRGWIPVASSGSGHLICVDLAPADHGVVGQVIVFYHDEPKRLVVADSVAQWLNRIARDLEDGLYEYDPEREKWSNEAFLGSALAQ